MKALISLIIFLSSGNCTGKSSDSLPPHGGKVMVGAIRWDGWVGDLHPAGLEIEYTLGPRQYHYRAPFYAREVSGDSIQCRAATQEIMDQEISYARYAGLDYWAFCWYPPGSGLDTARNLYLSSSLKNDINWCVILGTNPFDLERDGKWLLKRFKESNYQKVFNDRPLIYIFSSSSPGLNKITLGIRNMCRAAQFPEPYIVAMEFSPGNAAAAADSIGADAISCYASTYDYVSGDQFGGGPYVTTIMKSDEAGWEKYSLTGKQLVPWVTTGWSPKPRIERSVSWNTYYKSNGWAMDGTPEEIAQNLRNALTWVKNHKNATEANTILVYAWNEFDEGGWLCPTLGNNMDRINAFRKIRLR